MPRRDVPRLVVETLRAGRNLLTPHPPQAYPGIRVIQPGEWDRALIIPQEGQTIVALGGEHVYAYETIDGGKAQGFVLAPGDRATLLAFGLSFEMAEWRIERGPRPT